jgi:hypothetical protein
MRGIWHTMEAVIASVIVVGFLAAINSAYLFGVQPDDVAIKVYNTLHGLDNRGLLRNYTQALDYVSIANALESYTYNVSVQICDYAGSCVGSTPPTAGNVWTGTYITAGFYEYQPREVRFYLWPP